MVVHGPEAFDCGDVAEFVASVCPSRVIVAGVMGRTAAEESGIPHECAEVPPSSVFSQIEGLAFLLNHAKCQASAEAFGAIVARRLGQRGLVHAECLDRTVRLWGDADEDLAREIAARSGFTLARREIPGADPPGYRVLRGCIPGEPVCVNGIVIGTATASEVTLLSRRGLIIPGEGISPKEHGLEKLHAHGPVDLAHAWCKSGRIRRRPAVPLQSPPVHRQPGKVAIVDHCADELYASLGDNVVGILAVGDDTTRVCLHAGAHLGIPVLGITDGDEDGLVPGGSAPGSLIIRALHERDDDLGIEVATLVPDRPVIWEEWVSSVLAILDGRVTCISPGES